MTNFVGFANKRPQISDDDVSLRFNKSTRFTKAYNNNCFITCQLIFDTLTIRFSTLNRGLTAHNNTDRIQCLNYIYII